MIRRTIRALAAAIAVGPILAGNDYVLHIGVMVCIFGTLGLSMNMMLKIGQLSLAQGALMGIGAYGSALLTLRAGLPVPLAFVLGSLLSLCTALLVGPVFLRIKGVYFVLLTFCFGKIVGLVFEDWVSLFGGNNGLAGIPGLPGPAWPQWNYVLALCLIAAAWVMVSFSYRSALGRVLVSIEQHEALSLSFGLDAMRYRIATFGMSALLAGAAGAFYAHYLGFLNPTAFSMAVTIEALMLNVVGGIQWAAGPVVGALLLVPLPELLRDAQQYQLLIFGIAVILILLFAKRGVIGLFLSRARS